MRGLANSLVIGLFAVQLLPGQMLVRVTEGVVIALFSWSVLSGRSNQSPRTVETEKTVHYAPEADSGQSQPVETEKQTTKTEKKTTSDEQSVGHLPGPVPYEHFVAVRYRDLWHS